MQHDGFCLEVPIFFAAKTKAINFREVVSHHENAETMKDFLNLKKKWKERGKE